MGLRDLGVRTLQNFVWSRVYRLGVNGLGPRFFMKVSRWLCKGELEWDSRVYGVYRGKVKAEGVGFRVYGSS